MFATKISLLIKTRFEILIFILIVREITSWRQKCVFFQFNMLLFVTHFHTRPYRIVGNFIKTCGSIKIHQAGSVLWFQQQR